MVFDGDASMRKLIWVPTVRSVSYFFVLDFLVIDGDNFIVEAVLKEDLLVSSVSCEFRFHIE